MISERYMRHALSLAARGLGHTWPNPSVGAVIVKDNKIVGRGFTARGGRPHAETIALKQAGDHADGATLYVTLEPCAHQGKTPPCTKAIIGAGIKKVVVACTDPNPEVSGKGFKQLRNAGIEVTENVCQAEAEKLNEGFFSVLARKRPFITLKVATSLDGKIAAASGETKWITSEASRRMVHYLRSEQDAIITGLGTVLVDNPHLNCRLPGREMDSPQRILVDSKLRIPKNANILPAWIFTTEEAAGLQSEINAKIFTAPQEGGTLSLASIIDTITQQGITRLFVEAGSALATSFMQQNLVDRIYWFRAPFIIGAGGLDALQGEDLPSTLNKRYTLISSMAVGNDVLEIYENKGIV